MRLERTGSRKQLNRLPKANHRTGNMPVKDFVKLPLLFGVTLLLVPYSARAQKMEMDMHMGAPDVAGEAKLDVATDGNDIVLTLGPVRLPPHGQGAMMRLVPAHFADLPRGGTISSFDVELVDAFNRQVDKKYLHHVNLILPDRRELFLPVMQRLAASGA